MAHYVIAGLLSAPETVFLYILYMYVCVYDRGVNESPGAATTGFPRSLCDVFGG